MSVSTQAAVVCVVWLTAAVPAWAQAVAGPEKARPVQGDPGISSMVVLDRPEFRILRDYAEPGATRRMHNHADATYQVFVLVTGHLRLTIEGAQAVDVNQGEALYLEGGARHTFTNVGEAAATIVEVFGKGPARPGDRDAMAALARGFGAEPPKR
ncbi:MAG: cupin domain-containing protein [Vicinamibacterales bacterium]